MRLLIISVLVFINFAKGHIQLDLVTKNPAFNPDFIESFLNPELCEEQMGFIAQNDTLLRLQFLDSGLRLPRGILSGNTLDLGNYYQCLGINEDIGNSVIEGKYCMIKVPLNQEFIDWDDISEWLEFNPNQLRMSDEIVKRVLKYKGVQLAYRNVGGNGFNNQLREIPDVISGLEFTLSVCVPKVCTTQEGINGLLFNLTNIGFRYDDDFCRVNNDKPWVPGDYVAIAIFSLVGLITFLSTSYDVWHIFIAKSDPETVNTLYRSFSVYTNTCRMTTFTSNPDSLECIDGIRALAMAWVIVGHTFLTLPSPINVLDSIDWTLSIRSQWVTAAPISVDTFFMLSGLLLVYTTSGKLTGMKLLKNLHLFYLNRILRMLPILAAIVLLQVSVFNRITDGPNWNEVAMHTNLCRTNWWSTLLYVQNYAHTQSMCLGHTWYLAQDMQLHILSPLVLFWVLSGNKKSAWISMVAALMVFLISPTIYNFVMQFPGSHMAPGRDDENRYYSVYYYLNTFTRASPFVVGMIFGYVLHLTRGKKLQLSKGLAIIMWILALSLTTLAFMATQPMKNLDWDNQTVDSLVNSFMRPVWAMGLGWIILACVHGFGGPVNWLLSLNIWKLPSRLSYGMYLFHYPIMFIMSGTTVAQDYFTVSNTLYRFVGHFVLSLSVSFIVTLIIDSPLSTLIKMFLGKGPKKPSISNKEQQQHNNTSERR